MENTRLNQKYTFLASETVLDKHNETHQTLIDRMDKALYKIWEHAQSGDPAAQVFMTSETRRRLVQFQLDFQNNDIPERNPKATYGAYKSIMAELLPLLRNNAPVLRPCTNL